MNVELKNSAGEVLFAGTLPYVRAVNDQAIEAARNALADGYPTVWRHVEFPSTIALNLGETYHLEFSAPEDAGFAMASYIYKHMRRRDLGRSSNRNEWEEAHAEVSTDGGRSWGFFVPPSYFSERDLPVLFTIEGMPSRLPL